MTTTSSGRHENRLANEKSPYLLQHADNPVDWYPWDKEAFEKARRENKPIFLSVGYSTCHWCHVMAHESFENEEIAKIMNENFVNIKVDREVRPDVDRMYMAFVTATFGEGGWPMSVFLTPDLYPIFGGTYFPPKDRYGRLGFPSLLKRIAQLWKEQPDKMKESGKNVIEQLRSISSSGAHDLSQDALSVKTAHKCYTYFADNFDAVEGGFGGEPKFPTPVRLHFLLRHYYYNISESGHPDGSFDNLSVAEIREKGARLGIDFKGCIEKNEYLEMLKMTVENQFQEAQSNLNMVALTLTKIARGGIHDHISNGFHRYSTDHYWHVPHFEKMLYDQAQLLTSFIEAYLITKNEYYAENARDIIKYVERDLQDPASGAFFSAEDADSYPYDGAPHKLEGAFAVWEKSELDRILGDEDSRIFCYHFGVENNGNVPRGKDVQGELVNKNVLIKRHTLKETADEFNLSQEAVNEILTSCKNKLAKVRAEGRPKPHRDDKILTAWNGLMISGLSRAYNALGEKKFLELAEGAAKFLKDRMYDTDRKVILRSFREEVGNVEGFSDDYSFLIQGLLDLYESTFNESYLAWAVDLQETQNELFYDEEGGGGYFNVSDDNKSILVRMKDDHDGAEPSPNSVTISNLLRLYSFVQNPDYNTKAEATLKSYVGTLQNRPHSMPSLVASMMLFLKGVKQIVIVGQPENPTTREFISTIRGQFLPNCVLMFTPVGKDVDSSLLAQKNDVIKSILQSSASEIEPTPAVHICENFTCNMPIQDVETLASTLKTNIFFEWDPE